MFSNNLILKPYEFNGQIIKVPFTNAAFFNATAAAKFFGKLPKDWLKTEDAKKYIEAVRRKILTEENQLVIVKQGGNDEQGTWLHPKLGIVFARWLNVDFALWCDEQIESILHGNIHPQATRTTTNAQEIVDTFHCLLKLAHTCGFENNQALLSADSGTKKLVGTSALALIEATHLHADQRGRTYTPTELGRMLPIRESGKAFNRKLNLCGLQERDDAGCWIPTVKAQGLYEWFDTGKRHSDGVPVKQLKWFVSVLDAAKYSWQRAA